MEFADPIVGGTTLIREAIRSPDYAAGTAGWSIDRDGSAEFNDATVRGTLEVTGTRDGDEITVTIADGAIDFDIDPDEAGEASRNAGEIRAYYDPVNDTTALRISNTHDDAYILLDDERFLFVESDLGQVIVRTHADDLTINTTGTNNNILIDSDAGDIHLTAPDTGHRTYAQQLHHGHAKYSLSGNQNITTGTATKVQFDTEDSDSDVDGYALASNVVTVPRAGLYLITIYIMWEANATGYRRTWLKVNGSRYVADSQSTLIANALSNRIVEVVPLAANDTIEAEVEHNAGVTIFVNGGTGGAFDSRLVVTQLGMD